MVRHKDQPQGALRSLSMTIARNATGLDRERSIHIARLVNHYRRPFRRSGAAVLSSLSSMPAISIMSALYR